jgi:hypothetical protein
MTASHPTATLAFKNALTIPFDALNAIAVGCRGGCWSLDTHRFVPIVPNFAAVDSIELGLRLVQITTKRTNHELKVTSGRSAHESLAAIAETLLPLMGPSRWGSCDAYLEVYFAVPEGCGDSFKQQKLEFYGEKSSSSDAPGSPSLPVLVSVAGAPRAERIASCPSSFMLLIGGKQVTVEVRQFVLEVPLSAFQSAGESPPRDAIDEAAET